MKKLPVRVILAAFATAAIANCQISSVVNAASRSPEAVAPGSLITVLGTRFANGTAQLEDARTYPSTLGGVSLTVGGLTAGLLYVSPTQVNARIDPNVPPGQAAVVLTGPNGTFNSTVTVAAAAPGLFSLNGLGVGDGAVIHAITFALTAFSPKTGNGPTFLSLYATGIDVTETPVVRIAGVQVPVLWAGNVQPAGLQQVNVQLLDSLAGAGRVSVELESRGKRSNTVQIVLVPNRGQGPFADNQDNETRNREIAALAWVPGTSLVLVADENDDVVRVADVVQKKIVRTIVLAGGSSPSAIAVNAAGTLAVVAERSRGRVALLDLAASKVTSEVVVGKGPVAVALAGTTVLTVNQEDNTVSAFDLQTPNTVATIAVQRGPSDIAVNAAGTRAYVTNREAGSVSIIDVAARAVLDTISLGTSVRPTGIVLVEPANSLIVSDPGAGPDGKLLVVNLATKQIVTANANPAGTGGISDLVLSGTTLYGTNQAGSAVTVATLVGIGGNLGLSPSTIPVEMGARALALDTKDNLLIVANEGTGGLGLIDLATNKVVGRIDAVRSSSDDQDDRGDRERAANMPAVTGLSPSTGKAGTTFSLTITGTGLTGTRDVIFVDPASMPGKGHGHGNGNDDFHDNGPFGKQDTGITASNIVVNTAGTSVTAQIKIAAGHDAAKLVVRVLTPNGESTFVASAGNTFNVTK